MINKFNVDERIRERLLKSSDLNRQRNFIIGEICDSGTLRILRIINYSFGKSHQYSFLTSSSERKGVGIINQIRVYPSSLERV